MNEPDEREWQRQEQARLRANGAKPVIADRDGPLDADDQSHRAIARVLRPPQSDDVPADFEVSAASAILARAASDRRVGRRFERRVLALLWLAYAVVLACAAFVFARDGLPALDGTSWRVIAWFALGAGLCLTGVHWRRR